MGALNLIGSPPKIENWRDWGEGSDREAPSKTFVPTPSCVGRLKIFEGNAWKFDKNYSSPQK